MNAEEISKLYPKDFTSYEHRLFCIWCESNFSERLNEATAHLQSTKHAEKKQKHIALHKLNQGKVDIKTNGSGSHHNYESSCSSQESSSDEDSESDQEEEQIDARIRRYPNELERKGLKLFCKLCDKHMQSVSRTFIARHRATSTHKEKRSLLKKTLNKKSEDDREKLQDKSNSVILGSITGFTRPEVVKTSMNMKLQKYRQILPKPSKEEHDRNPENNEFLQNAVLKNYPKEFEIKLDDSAQKLYCKLCDVYLNLSSNHFVIKHRATKPHRMMINMLRNSKIVRKTRSSTGRDEVFQSLGSTLRKRRKDKIVANSARKLESSKSIKIDPGKTKITYHNSIKRNDNFKDSSSSSSSSEFFRDSKIANSSAIHEDMIVYEEKLWCKYCFLEIGKQHLAVAAHIRGEAHMDRKKFITDRSHGPEGNNGRLDQETDNNASGMERLVTLGEVSDNLLVFRNHTRKIKTKHFLRLHDVAADEGSSSYKENQQTKRKRPDNEKSTQTNELPS